MEEVSNRDESWKRAINKPITCKAGAQASARCSLCFFEANDWEGKRMFEGSNDVEAEPEV